MPGKQAASWRSNGANGWQQPAEKQHWSSQRGNGQWSNSKLDTWSASNRCSDYVSATSSRNAYKRPWARHEAIDPIGSPPESHWQADAAPEAARQKSPEADEPARTGCSEAKVRLVRMRQRLPATQVEVLVKALKRKRDDLPLDELTDFGPDVIDDVQTVIEQDVWDGKPSGREWLKDWLESGIEWEKYLEERPPEDGPNYCRLCWKAYSSDWDFQKHTSGRDHRKRQRTWAWRYGVPIGELVPAPDSTDSAADRPPTCDRSPVVAGAARGSKASLATLQRAHEMRDTAVADAKRRLLEYRDRLTAAQRREILEHIGLTRANDTPSVSALQDHFDSNVAGALQEVNDPKWTFEEPTFSWLSGFYWHPESTTLEQQGQRHTEWFCHLCESDSWTEEEYQRHLVTRRHAENSLRWAEQMGNMEHPSHCGRCPGAKSSCAPGGEELDLEHRRAPGKGDARVVPETVPPVGFKELWDGDRGRVLATPYMAVVADGVDRRAHAVRLMCSRPIGPKEKGSKKRWHVDLYWCRGKNLWRSLAIPLLREGSEPLSSGEAVEVSLSVRWGADEKESWDEFPERTRLKVPKAGEVFVQHFWRGQSQGNGEQVPILEFVGKGQVETAGGIEALRGTQRPMQFATEDCIISFLFYVPAAAEPRPLLVFYHGDMPRGVAQCPQPGLADFATTYGPALMVVDPRKHGHPCSDFVVVTPVSPEEVWWLRFPALHDTTTYAVSVERCLRGIIQMTYDLGICLEANGACFAGQSMGAYMALEMARVMPEGTASVVAGAPCFDACRLDHLAARLINVPVWLLIGRNDAMCSFEEVASLALKMRDLDCKHVRLTSVGIKGHSEVGKKLEKWELYDWMRNPHR